MGTLSLSFFFLGTYLLKLVNLLTLPGISAVCFRFVYLRKCNTDYFSNGHFYCDKVHYASKICTVTKTPFNSCLLVGLGTGHALCLKFGLSSSVVIRMVK